MTPTEKTIFAAIKAAAREGRECPSNTELGMLLDCRSFGTPSKAIQTLERDGHIIVQRYSNARIVTFPGADGLSTADPFATARATHAGNSRAAHVGRGRAARDNFTAARPDACSFCGMRPDIAACTCKPRATGITVLRGRMPQEIAA